MTNLVTAQQAAHMTLQMVEHVQAVVPKKSLEKKSRDILKKLRTNTVIFDEDNLEVEIQVVGTTSREIGVVVKVNDFATQAGCKFADNIDAKAHQGETILYNFATALSLHYTVEEAAEIIFTSRFFLAAMFYATDKPQYTLPYTSAPFVFENEAAA